MAEKETPDTQMRSLQPIYSKTITTALRKVEWLKKSQRNALAEDIEAEVDRLHLDHHWSIGSAVEKGVGEHVEKGAARDNLIEYMTATLESMAKSNHLDRWLNKSYPNIPL